MRAIDADDFGNRMYHEVFEKDTDMQKWDSGCWVRYKLFENVLREQPTIEPEPQWIPCSKELPKIGSRVVGTYKNSLFENGPYVVRVMRREKKYWVGDDEHWFLYENIIAWKPLPEPYNRVEKGT